MSLNIRGTVHETYPGLTCIVVDTWRTIQRGLAFHSVCYIWKSVLSHQR